MTRGTDDDDQPKRQSPKPKARSDGGPVVMTKARLKKRDDEEMRTEMCADGADRVNDVCGGVVTRPRRARDA